MERFLPGLYKCRYVYGFYRFAWRLKGKLKKEISNSLKSPLRAWLVRSNPGWKGAHPHLIVNFEGRGREITNPAAHSESTLFSKKFRKKNPIANFKVNIHRENDCIYRSAITAIFSSCRSSAIRRTLYKTLRGYIYIYIYNSTEPVELYSDLQLKKKTAVWSKFSLSRIGKERRLIYIYISVMRLLCTCSLHGKA